MLRHLGASAAYLLHKSARDRTDHAAHTAHAWTGGADLPAGLSMRWLGTAGFELAYEGHHLLIDPYVTRLSMRAMLGRRAVRPSGALIDHWIDRADAIFVGHTHFDHALDVPEIAARTGATAYGSTSLHRLMALHGLPERAVVAEPYRVYEIGPFEVTPVPSLHAKISLGRKVPMDGELTCDSLEGLMPRAYKCGQTWGFHIKVGDFTIYHQGSAELIDDAVRHHGVDLFLCGIAGRQFSDRYLERALRLLDPGMILPAHYDDFLRPLDAPMGFTFDVDLTGFVRETGRAGVELRTLDIGRTITG